jgi:hypothetical protein
MSADEIPTPQCDRLHALRSERDTVMEFLDWLQEQGIQLGRYDHNYYDGGLMVAVNRTHEQVVMDFLEIDPVALENERRALLESLRAR